MVRISFFQYIIERENGFQASGEFDFCQVCFFANYFIGRPFQSVEAIIPYIFLQLDKLKHFKRGLIVKVWVIRPFEIIALTIALSKVSRL